MMDSSSSINTSDMKTEAVEQNAHHSSVVPVTQCTSTANETIFANTSISQRYYAPPLPVPMSAPSSGSSQETTLLWSNLKDCYQTLCNFMEPSRQTVSSWLIDVTGRSWNSALKYVFNSSTSANGQAKSADDYVEHVCAYCGDAICIKRSEKESGRIVVCGAHCLQNWVAHSGFLNTANRGQDDKMLSPGNPCTSTSNGSTPPTIN